MSAPAREQEQAAAAGGSDLREVDLTVTGMTCASCSARVEKKLSKVPGVAGVDVELVAEGTSTVHVRSAEPVDDGAVRAAVDEAGYAVVGAGTRDAATSGAEPDTQADTGGGLR